MSALPYQHIPTLAQQRELKRWVQRHYPVSQYVENQDEAIADMQAARLRYVERDEPATFPTPGEDGEPQVWERVGTTPLLIIFALACIAWVIYFWSTP